MRIHQIANFSLNVAGNPIEVATSDWDGQTITVPSGHRNYKLDLDTGDCALSQLNGKAGSSGVIHVEQSTANGYEFSYTGNGWLENQVEGVFTPIATDSAALASGKHMVLSYYFIEDNKPRFWKTVEL